MNKLWRTALTLMFIFVTRVTYAAVLDGTTHIVVDDTYYTFDDTTTGADGFVWLRGGFTIADSATSDITLTVAAPVMSTVGPNGGTIKLGADLPLDSSVTVTGGATIKGEGYTIQLGGDLAYASTMYIASETTIDCRGYVFTLDMGGVMAINDGQALTLKNAHVVLRGDFAMMGTGSTLNLDNCMLSLDSNYTFTQGAVNIYNNCSVTGASSKTLGWTSPQNFTIKEASLLLLDNGIVFDHNNAITSNFVFTNFSSRLALQGATFRSTNANGVVLKSGVLWVDHKSAIDGDVSIGAGAGVNELDVHLLPGTLLEFPSGSAVYNDG